MRISLSILCFSLLTSVACADKKFSAGTDKGSADAAPEAPVLGESEPPPPVREIEFGATEVFRIGDGYSGANSACIGEVKSHDLKGTTYYFQFEVLEDNSKVDFSIGKFCGVDRESFTSIALQDESKGAIGSEVDVPTDASRDISLAYSPLGSQTLKKGVYSLVVTSKNIEGRPSPSEDPSDDEYDDFVVGKIQIKSNKVVRQLKVFAE